LRTPEELTITDATTTAKTAAITATDMRVYIALAFLLASPCALSWDGYDYEKGAFVEIQKGNKVRAGEEIEVFDYDKGEFIEVEVQSIRRTGRSVTVEVIDSETGEDRTLEMDAD